MPGTLLLKDYESANGDELQQHLSSLMAKAPPPSDSLTNPVIQPTPAPPTVLVDNSQDATQTRDELQAHLDDLMAPPRPLQLFGEGLTSLGAGAQNVRQELQNHLTSLIAQPAPMTNVPTPSDSLTNPRGTGNAAPPDRSLALQDYARQAAQRAGIDPDIFVREIQQESGFNPTAKSPAGALGIGQFMPSTAAGLNLDPTDPYASLDAAAKMDAQNLQTYGGDWGKTLAAFNAGPGAVQQYGGVPPFEETKRYVANILGGAKEAVQGAGQALSTAINSARGTGGDVSQFGDAQLTASEAAAACGPAAAVRFAQRFGRNPTLREATDMALSVGWSQGQGMAGIGSEKALLDKMGVATKLVNGPDWGTFADEARTGNPVIISTPGHYFTADNWNPQTNQFHVGRSGLDLKGGSEWMTPEQIVASQGAVQGGLLADNPNAPASTAATQPGFTAPGGSTDQQAAAVDAPKPLQLIGEGFSMLGQGAQDAAAGGLKVIDNAINAVADTSGPQTAQQQPIPSDVLTNPLGTGNAPQPSAQLTGQPSGGIAAPSGGPTGAAGLLERARQVGDVVGPTVEEFAQGTGEVGKYAPSRLLQGAETALGEQVLGGPNAPRQRLGAAIEGLAPSVEAANIPVASGLASGALRLGGGLIGAPSVTDSMRTIEDLAQKYEGADQSQMTPEDRRAYGNAIVAIGGVTLPGGEGGARARPGVTEVPAAGEAAEVARLRLNKFPDWLQPTIEDAARATDFAAEQRRGVIPNAQAEAMADQVRRSVDDWIAQSQPGKIFNTEETRALRNAVTSQAQTVNDLAKQVSDAAASGLVDDRLVARSVAEGDKLQALISVMEGNRAEWGRAGQAWQAATRLVDLPPGEAITQIYKTLGGRDNALEAVQHYNELVQSGAGPMQMANFWAGIKNPPANVGDWLKALRYNSMLSGPRTVEVNAIGNALELPWRLARDAGASFARGRPEEMAPELSGLLAGFGKGNRAFMDTWTHGLTQEQLTAGELPNTLASRVRNPVGKAVAGAIDIPSRILASGDAWGSAVAQSMALGRRAGVMASKEGLGGDAWKERVAELMANPSGDMLKEANAIAERMVYHGDMGQLGDALSQVQRVPVLGNAILPFLRTVYHIAARGVDRTPLGLAGTVTDVARGKYGPLTRSNLREQLARSAVQEGADKGLVPLGERFGDNLMGSALTYAFYTKAQAGLITGAGPDDPEKRAMLKAQGWQPYSVKIGDHYVSYSNWGPIAESLASVAAVAEAQDYAKSGASPLDVLVDEGKRTAKLVTEQSYLQGVGTLWKAFDDPQRYGGQALGQFITSLVPYGSALNTLGQATDELQRQPTKAKEGLGAYLGESLEARLPGLRQNVPAAQDQLGRPVPNDATGLGALNPLRSTQVRSSAVLAELLRYGADVGQPPASVRNVDLTPAEERTVNEKAGQYIDRNVQAVMADADYQNADGLGKQRALQRAVERARTQAGGELLQSLSEAEIKRRLEESRTKREPVPIGLGG